MEIINGVAYTISNGSVYVGSDTSQDYNALLDGNVNTIKRVHVESYVNGYKVLSIGKYAFRHSFIEYIWIPKTIETLDYDSLAHSPLQIVEFEKDSHLTTLGRGVFYNDTQLETITFGERLQNADGFVFEYSGIKIIFYYGMFTINQDYLFHNSGYSYPDHIYVCKNAPFTNFGEVITGIEKVLECPIKHSICTHYCDNTQINTLILIFCSIIQ